MKILMIMGLSLLLASCMPPVTFQQVSGPDVVTAPVIKCSDSHALNIGAIAPCSCQSGYDLDTHQRCVLKTAPICETFSKSLDNTQLVANDFIGNQDGLSLKMQTDGNLVLYNGANTYLNALWNSQTQTCGPNCKANLQSDGNLVIVDGANSPVFNASSMGCSQLTITNCSRPSFSITGCSASYPAPPPPVENWVHCSGETGLCSFNGIKKVRYGTPGSYFYKTLSSSVPCSNESFGDPAPTISKNCDYNANTSDTEPLTFPSSSQVIDPLYPTMLVVSNVSEYYGFGEDHNGVPFDWGTMNPSVNSYVEYTVTISESKAYAVSLSVSIPGINSVILTVNGNTVGTVSLASTPDWSTYLDNRFVLPVAFPVGTYRLRFIIPSGGTSINIGGVTLTPIEN